MNVVPGGCLAVGLRLSADAGVAVGAGPSAGVAVAAEVSAPADGSVAGVAGVAVATGASAASGAGGPVSAGAGVMVGPGGAPIGGVMAACCGWSVGRAVGGAVIVTGMVDSPVGPLRVTVAVAGPS